MKANFGICFYCLFLLVGFTQVADSQVVPQREQYGGTNANKQAEEWFVQGMKLLLNNTNSEPSQKAKTSQEAFTLIYKAANEDYSMAQYALYECYINGIGTDFNIQEGFKWLQKAAGNGYVPAMLVIGRYCYIAGTQNEITLQYVKRAAKTGDVDSIYYVGKILIESNKAQESIVWLKKAADAGHISAIRELGKCYIKGLGVDKDINVGGKYCLKAAKNGDIEAQYEIAQLYSKCKNIKNHHQKALKWYNTILENFNKKQPEESLDRDTANLYFVRSNCKFDYNLLHFKELTESNKKNLQLLIILEAENKCFCMEYNAMLEIGHFYEKADDPIRNYELAFNYYLEACKRGQLEAFYECGRCYEYGIGVKQDIKTAIEFYQKAIPGEQPINYVSQATIALSNCYIKGKGIQKDVQKGVDLLFENIQLYDDAEKIRDLAVLMISGFRSAFSSDTPEEIVDNRKECPSLTFLKKLAEDDILEAQTTLSWLYGKGIGLEQDYKQAIKWAENPAINNDPKAQLILGFIYMSFDDKTPQNLIDMDKGFYWIKKSAINENQEAQYYLGTCYLIGMGNVCTIDTKQAFIWFEKSAKQGFPLGQCLLGLSYLRGMGTNLNTNEGIRWLKRAVQNHSFDAAYYLALEYYKGEIVEQNTDEAIKLLEFAAISDNQEYIQTLEDIKSGIYDSESSQDIKDILSGDL